MSPNRREKLIDHLSEAKVLARGLDLEMIEKLIEMALLDLSGQSHYEL